MQKSNNFRYGVTFVGFKHPFYEIKCRFIHKNASLIQAIMTGASWKRLGKPGPKR